KRLDPDFLEIFYVYPFPGTPLYELCVQEGLLPPGEIPREAYAEPAAPGLYLSVAEFARLRRRAMRQYYLRPRIIIRTLRGARSPRELANYLRHGWRQLKDLLTG
ncbi:MAG: hypothetical protein M1457_05775, partial [bacterium]|nr:hypothetical protein [bacterium]